MNYTPSWRMMAHEPLVLPDAVRPALLDAGMAPALKLKLAICAAVIALGLAFGTGWWLRGLQVKAAMVKQTQAQAKADVQQAQRTSEAVQTHAEAKVKTEIRYVTTVKEVEKLVERPVYLERCMDDDGLRVLNAQILGTDTPGPGPALPEAGHPAGRDGR